MGQIILGTSQQTAKVFKTVFTKIGHTAVSKPQLVGFSSTKTDYNKSERQKKFFQYACVGFSYQNHLYHDMS